MIERIDRLLTALKSHKAASSQSADELVFQSLIESAGDPKEDHPPPPPEGVHQNVKEQPVYSKMMASLVDQVRKEVGDAGNSGDEFEAYITGITGHRSKIEGLQKELNAKLVELEAEEKRYITSDDLHLGFDYSNVRWPGASTCVVMVNHADRMPGAKERLRTDWKFEDCLVRGTRAPQPVTADTQIGRLRTISRCRRRH